MSRCTIVMYHYVRDVDETPYPRINARSLGTFHAQLDQLGEQYSVIDLRNYLDHLALGTPVPAEACVLTFDDGLKDHVDHVLPALLERGLTASFFVMGQPLREGRVPTVHQLHFLLASLGTEPLAAAVNQALEIDHPALYDRFQVRDEAKRDLKYRWDDPLTTNLKWTLSHLPHHVKIPLVGELFRAHFPDEASFCDELYLDRDDLRALAEAGMDVGGHSDTHPFLSDLSAPEQREELTRGHEALTAILGDPPETFAYPYGGFNEETIRILQELGYRGAVTTDLGHNDGANPDPFRLERVDTNDIPFGSRNP